MFARLLPRRNKTVTVQTLDAPDHWCYRLPGEPTDEFLERARIEADFHFAQYDTWI